jgi:hypothetical protein
VQTPVLWLDFDNGTRRCAERFAALARGHGVGQDIPLLFASLPPFVASDGGCIRELIRRLKAQKTGLLAIDNLGLVSGAADENSCEMIGVMGALRRVAEEAETAVVLVHHQRKASGFTSRKGDTLRGHSSIEAALDLALLVERDETDADTVIVRSTKSRDTDVFPFAATFAFKHRDGSHDLHSATFFGTVIDDQGSDRAIRDSLLRLVEAEPGLNQGQLTDLVRGELPDAARDRVIGILKALTRKRKLVEKRGKDNAKTYCLCEPA